MLTEIQKSIVKILQEDIPHSKEPFSDIATNLGITEENLFKEINFLIDQGFLRRMGAVLLIILSSFSLVILSITSSSDKLSFSPVTLYGRLTRGKSC